MVDYCIVNQEGWDRLIRLDIENRVESDHQPLEVRMRGSVGRFEEEEQVTERTIEKWNEESIRRYKERGKMLAIEGESVEEI